MKRNFTRLNFLILFCMCFFLFDANAEYQNHQKGVSHRKVRYQLSKNTLKNYSTQKIKIGSKNFGYTIYADFDGDKKKEKSFWNNNTGVWSISKYYNYSVKRIKWGKRGDIPFSGDLDNDGIDEIAVYRPSTDKCHISLNNEPWPSRYEHIVNNCKKYLKQ